MKSLGEFERDPAKRLGVSTHCKKCRNHYAKLRYHRNIERARELNRLKAAGKFPDRQKERQRAIEIYGGQCGYCGDTRNLQFDHVNWDGNEHRKVESAQQMIARIARLGHRITDHELQLLCRECHQQRRPTPSLQRIARLAAASNDWPVPGTLNPDLWGWRVTDDDLAA